MFKKILLFLLILFTSLKAEVIESIDVVGNNRISDETIKIYGGIELGKDYTNENINSILKNLYETNFFEKIDLTLSKSNLKIIVQEYPVVNSIDLKGEDSKNIKKYILDRIQLKTKESFIPNILNEDIRLIKNLYSSMGFNFVKIKSKIDNFSDNRINLVYEIEKGNKTFIKKINFIGDKKIKDTRLLEVIVSEENKFWKILSKNTFLRPSNIELDKRLLSNYYKSLGYYDVQILSNNSEFFEENYSILTYTINAGTRYKINKISTNLDSVYDKELFTSLEKSYKKLIGKYYSPFKVKNLLDEIDSLVALNDLQFVEHSVNEIIENDSIEIKINVFEGKKNIVEKITILGNTITDENVIRGEFLLDEGDPFNQLKLEKTIARLKARNLFGEIKTNILDGSKNNQKIIELFIEEKPTGEISAGAGIGTNGGSFAFNVTESNWLGRGIKVSSDLELSAETFTGSLSFTDPNFNFSGNELTYYVANTKNDKPDSGFKNNIFSTGIGTKFEQYKDIYFAPNISFSYDDLKVKNNASSSLQKQKGTFTDVSFDYMITSDKRDKVYGPTEGYISSLSQAFPIYADAPFIKNVATFSSYQAFNKDLIGSFKVYAASISGLQNEDVRISKRLNLSNSRLRGFESGKVGPKDGKDYVGGNYAISTNFELNLPNLLPESTKTDVGLFLDFGNVWSVDYSDTIDDSNKLRSSVGVNTSWFSPVGPMSFVFSQNLSKASTDITESFNFRIGTTF